MLIRTKRKLPRLATIPGLEPPAYKALKSGGATNISDDVAAYLLGGGWCEPVEESAGEKETASDEQESEE